MEAGLAFDLFAVGGESGAAHRDGSVESLEGVDVLVDDGFVNQGPERFGRLHFGSVGGLEQEAQAVRHRKAGLAVPTGVVEHKNDAPVATSAGFFREQAQQRLEEWLGYAVREYPSGSGRLAGGTEVAEAVTLELTLKVIQRWMGRFLVSSADGAGARTRRRRLSKRH